MFIVFNKDKIKSYLISVSTVVILFMMSFAITNKNNEILRASANITKSENTYMININGIKDENQNKIENNIRENKTESISEEIYD